MIVTPLENCSTYFLAELAQYPCQIVLHKHKCRVKLTKDRRSDINHSMPRRNDEYHPSCSISAYNTGTKKLCNSLVPNDDPSLSTIFNFVHLNNRPITSFDLVHDILVNLKRVPTCLLQESSIRYRANISLSSFGFLCRRRGEYATRDEIASQLLRYG